MLRNATPEPRNTRRYPHRWHAVWFEEARSIVRTILRHRRAGNRDAAKAVRCVLPERLQWRLWTGTLTDRNRRHIAEAEDLATAAREMIEQGRVSPFSEGADV